jgi:molybdate transport system substrate-binding protein
MARLLLVLALLLSPLSARAQDLTVFAAASLTDAMKDIAPLWESGGRPKLRFNFAASSTLARQMEQGAPANLFASADEQWMDWAAARKLIVPETRRTLLGNTLVLVMPRDKVKPVTISPGMDIAALLGPGGRIAVGDPSNVPAGIYAQQALTKLGLWAAVEPHLARSDNVRSALLLVERGETPLGIVYSTDAAVAAGVAIAGTFPQDSYLKITYPFAVGANGDTPQARAFLDFLATPAAAAVFARRGFITE